ncbi:MAG TPA: glycine cleavage system aminomethyltransferase GcvT [Planctomycetota bacterium]
MSSPATLLRTALHAAHQAAGAKLVPFAGWDMPLDYGSILTEARAVRTSAGLFDVSHMARVWFRGPRAAAELDHALGGAIVDLPMDRARYTLLLDERGGILDDLIVYRTGEEEFFTVLNASNRQADLAALRARIAHSPVEDVTEDGSGILALQGPHSRAQLAALAGGRADFCSGFLDLAELTISGLGRLRVARTGYTGEHGYELFPGPGQMEPLWQRLVEAGAVPVGLGARDVLRLEAGLPLYGHEIDQAVNPFEAGLRFGVKGWKTREFVGAEALRAAPAPERELIGLTAEKRVPRQGYELLGAGEPVGSVCSGVWSATLERPIATAWCRKDTSGPLTVRTRGKEFAVKAVPLPFVPHRSRD